MISNISKSICMIGNNLFVCKHKKKSINISRAHQRVQRRNDINSSPSGLPNLIFYCYFTTKPTNMWLKQ